MSGFDAQLEALDLTLFESIESETSDGDKRALLALQVACRDEFQGFTWLEIGSYLGGSLQPLIRDPRCARIHSIDPRTTEQPDERWQEAVAYPQNSTTRMLESLGSVPGANLDKVRTYEAGTDSLDPETFTPPQVCFIDGEHTDEACGRDADFCRRAVRDEGLIAFHDLGGVYRAVDAFLDRLTADAVPHRGAYLPDNVFVVELGDSKLLEHPLVVSRHLAGGTGLLALLTSNGHYRTFLVSSRRARVLQSLRILPRTY